jgi:uncharacterized protein
MRDALFGQNQNQPRSSVPNVRPPEAPNRPVWNSGQAMPQAGQGQYNQAPPYAQPPYAQPPYAQPPYAQPPYAQPYGAPQAPMGGGGSFLGTAAAAAAGAVGGSLLLGSIRNMMGSTHQGFADAGVLGGDSHHTTGTDQSGGDLARDAGVNDIGSDAHHADSSGAGFYDQASNDAPDQDAMDLDSDDFGNDNGGGDSDFA